MDFCKMYSVALYATDNEQGRLLYARARCKSWSCAYCAEINRKQWLARMIEGIRKIDAERWGFWTLTHDLQDAEYIEQRKLLSSAWNRLIGHIKYVTKQEIYYIRALEIGTQGTRRMHMHVLVNYVPNDLKEVNRRDGTSYWHSEFWSERIQKVQFGRIADIRDVSGTLAWKSPEIASGSDLGTTRAVLAASYIAKYMSKTDEDTESRFPPYTRRFNTSRNFPKLRDKESFQRYEWSSGKKLDIKTAEGAWRHGLHVYDVQSERRITMDDFDENDEFIE